MDEIIKKIQNSRDEIMSKVKTESKSMEYKLGYYDGILDAYNTFRKELK